MRPTRKSFPARLAALRSRVFDRAGPSGRLLGARGPIIASGAKLALRRQLGDLLECGRGGVVVAEAPRGEARDPRSLRRPFASRALSPRVGHSPGVEVEAKNIIDECDAVTGFGAGFDG